MQQRESGHESAETGVRGEPAYAHLQHPPADRPTHDADVYVHGERDPRQDIFAQDRPWGDFRQFVSNERVTVKIITVRPGHRLSLQTHGRRGEMWQVLDGPMYIEVDERAWLAAPGETVWVPRGATHRMSNRSDQPARILEVAFGFFDEDDITRLQDDYARQDDDC